MDIKKGAFSLLFTIVTYSFNMCFAQTNVAARNYCGLDKHVYYIDDTAVIFHHPEKIESFSFQGGDNYNLNGRYNFTEPVSTGSVNVVFIYFLHNIEKFKNITNINIGNVTIDTLPQGITRLKKLHCLRLNCVIIKNNIQAISAIPNLMSLEYSGVMSGLNKMQLHRLNGSLKSLLLYDRHAYSSDLSFLEEVYGLYNLDALELFIGNIDTLSKNIGNLKRLRYLGISGKFKEIPSEIANLSKLRELRIGCSFISSFPDEMLKMKNLNLYISNVCSVDNFGYRYLMRLVNKKYPSWKIFITDDE